MPIEEALKYIDLAAVARELDGSDDLAAPLSRDTGPEEFAHCDQLIRDMAARDTGGAPSEEDDYWQARYNGLVAKLRLMAGRGGLNLGADVLDQQHGMTGSARVLRFVADLLHNEAL